MAEVENIRKNISKDIFLAVSDSLLDRPMFEISQVGGNSVIPVRWVISAKHKDQTLISDQGVSKGLGPKMKKKPFLTSSLKESFVTE